MIEATRRWFRRNRTNFLVGAGVIGAGYLAGQYVLGRLREARLRMSEDRISKENLRRRFEQNQEDCTYTVLALLPTIRDEIIDALPVEQITEQLQQERQERLKRLAASEAPSSEYPSAPPSIVDDASTASFIHTSQMGMSSLDDPSRPKRSKAQLWQDMKINSIARALSLLYTLSLLTLLTRIQLNLLGRRTYLSSVVSMASSSPDLQTSTISLEDRDDTAYGNDFETNRMYLTFSWWILHRGAKQILDRVIKAVRDVFGAVNIREDMTMERLSELIIEVRRRVEGATEQERRQQSWLQYLLPPREEELFVINQATHSDGSDASPEPQANPLDVAHVSPSLRRLLDETADLIDSPTFALVLSHLLDTGFSHLVDVRVASEAFKSSVPEGRISDITDAKCKLAHILPVFCRQAHAMVVGTSALDAMAGGQPLPNEYLVQMDRVHDLEAFAAVIYSSNFEYDQVDSPRETAQQSVISLTDSQPLELSKRVSTLTESIVDVEAIKESVAEIKPAFESAWQKAVAPAPQEDLSATQASLIELPSAAPPDVIAEELAVAPAAGLLIGSSSVPQPKPAKTEVKAEPVMPVAASATAAAPADEIAADASIIELPPKSEPKAATPATQPSIAATSESPVATQPAASGSPAAVPQPPAKSAAPVVPQKSPAPTSSPAPVQKSPVPTSSPAPDQKSSATVSSPAPVPTSVKKSDTPSRIAPETPAVPTPTASTKSPVAAPAPPARSSKSVSVVKKP